MTNEDSDDGNVMIIGITVIMVLLKKIQVSVSFNFMSLVPMMRITGTGVDLFTMQSARVSIYPSLSRNVPSYTLILSQNMHCFTMFYRAERSCEYLFFPPFRNIITFLLVDSKHCF